MPQVDDLKLQYSKEEIEKALERKRLKLKLPEAYGHKKLEDIHHGDQTGRYVSDFVYGANDGIITTFAVVTGAIGASLSPLVIIILGFANLLADGFSMAASSFLSKRSDLDYQKGQRQKEEWEIENFPEVEVDETREIFKNMGFSGKTIDDAVEVTIGVKKRWIDLMMIHELGIIEDQNNVPWKHSLATFFAFIIAGLAPLLPFIIPSILNNAVYFSPLFAGVTLFTAGALRTLVSPKKWLFGGLEMLAVGSIAGLVAFGVGYLLKQLFGVVA
ncbi:MAG TPA: VIT1/CCC1 transporter family protein [Patescibacteria group bacterium]